MKFIVSDTHFFHDSVNDFDNRPYKDVEEMSEDLIKRWNDVVGISDTVYLLGDMFFKVRRDLLEYVFSRLKGKIIYIRGNHESSIDGNSDIVGSHVEMRTSYEEVFVEYKDEKHRLVMSHYPIPSFNGHFHTGATHFYGHVHNSKEQAMAMYHQLMNFTNKNEKGIHKMLNVGVMMSYMGYRPMELNEAIALAEERADKMYEYFNEECGGKLPTYEEFLKREDLYM